MKPDRVRLGTNDLPKLKATIRPPAVGKASPIRVPADLVPNSSALGSSAASSAPSEDKSIVP